MTTDVVELNLVDHQRFEELLRRLRDRSANRAELLVAHAEDEEAAVYPSLRGYQGIEDADVEHGVQEHAEGQQTLLALMEVGDPQSSEWDRTLEDLLEAVTHHLDEEQRTILDDAQENVPKERRIELGAAFQRVRQERIDAGCGSIDYIRKLVAPAARRRTLCGRPSRARYGSDVALAELHRLRRLGFRHKPILGEDGEVEVVSDNPLYIPPGTAEHLIPLDDVVTVVHALLTLPAP
jgi:hemerythrin HHE cation binding domain-containing protein